LGPKSCYLISAASLSAFSKIAPNPPFHKIIQIPDFRSEADLTKVAAQLEAEWVIAMRAQRCRIAFIMSARDLRRAKVISLSPKNTVLAGTFSHPKECFHYENG
jgi:hypothetical protein